MNSIQIIFKYWLKTKREFIISFVYQILSTIFTVSIPIYIGRIVGTLFDENPSVSNLWMFFTFVVVLSILSYVTNRLGRMKGARSSSRATFYMRRDINDTIYKQSFSYFDQNVTGNLVAIATSDVEQTNRIFGFGLGTGSNALVRMVGVYIITITLALINNMPFLALTFGLSIPLAMFTKVKITSKMRPIYLETRESFGELTNNLYENILGADVVRIFSKQEKENQKFQKNNLRFFNASMESVKYSNMLPIVNAVLTTILTISSLYFCGFQVINSGLDVDILVTFLSYVAQTLFPLRIFGQLLLAFMQGDAALVRIRQILDAVPDVREADDAVPLEKETLNGEVEFENVSFGYLIDHQVLNNISFHIPAGKKVAIMGTTGSGKSTIINLLPRFYDVSSGAIKIDGVNIKKFKLQDLRMNIGVVSQETYLFNKTIRENVAYGKSLASEDEIRGACKIAALHDFIMTLPNGYDSMVGERGMRLSGGQKQRLSIARALIVEPKILIFDDSTSSVDVETEYRIQQALENVMKNTTTFIITQRISTIRNADIIILLDKGRIIGLGDHSTLIENNALYRQIYETLFQKQTSGDSAPFYESTLENKSIGGGSK